MGEIPDRKPKRKASSNRTRDCRDSLGKTKLHSFVRQLDKPLVVGLSAPYFRGFEGKKMDLFAKAEEANRQSAQPLAARMRPKTLDEVVGQSHILAPGKLLRRLVASGRVQSLLF